tara:strand:+ start:559 stop:903 length:345 start_codon:yes stop_codon:yes gene_type:complete
MPPRLYCLETKEYYKDENEYHEARRKKDNIGTKLFYYKKNYGYVIKKNEIDEFIKHKNIIKKICKHHDFFLEYEPDRTDYTLDEINILCDYKKHFDNALHLKDYIRTLERVNNK